MSIGGIGVKSMGGTERKTSTVQEPQRKLPQAGNRIVLLDQSPDHHTYKNISLPIIIRDSYIIAIVDTGSTFSLIQQSALH